MLPLAEAPLYDCDVRILRAIAIVLGLVGAAASATAQPSSAPPVTPPHPLSEYGGVTPGSPNPPPRVGQLRSRTRAPRARPTEIIAWPGFQMQPGGGSRFFVETTGPVVTEVHASSGRVEIVFHDAAVHLANSRRWLETQYFETPVVRARLERRRRDMVLVMHMRAAATPMLSSGADPSGFTFTYIDFAPGHYLPEAPSPPPPPPQPRDQSASVRPASPDSETAYPVEEEDERPPPVQVR